MEEADTWQRWREITHFGGKMGNSPTLVKALMFSLLAPIVQGLSDEINKSCVGVP